MAVKPIQTDIKDVNVSFLDKLNQFKEDVKQYTFDNSSAPKPVDQVQESADRTIQEITGRTQNVLQGIKNRFGEFTSEVDARVANPLDITTLAMDVTRKGAELMNEFVEDVDLSALELIDRLPEDEQAMALFSSLTDAINKKLS